MDMSDDTGTPDTIFVTLKGETSGLPGESGTIVALDLDARHAPGFWALQLDQAMRDLKRPTIVVANGLAAAAFAHWALLSPRSYLAGISGAILRSPAEAPPALKALAAAFVIGPLIRLPFASVIVADLRSPLLEETSALASRWGSQLIGERAGQGRAAALRGVGAQLAAAFRTVFGPRRRVRAVLPPLDHAGVRLLAAVS
jgi:hypothetical protein